MFTKMISVFDGAKFHCMKSLLEIHP